MTSSRPPRIPYLLLSLGLLLPLLFLLPVAGRTFSRAALALDLPHLQMDNEEGALLFQALEMRSGRSIYRPLSESPWFVGTYPPLFMAAAAVAADPTAPDLWSGRLLAAASAAGIALLIAAITVIRTRNAAAAILAAVLFPATFEVYSWVAYYRVDLPAVFFTVAGLGCIACAPDRRWARAFSILLFALAFYTKQTTVMAPAAATLALLLRDRRTGLRYAAFLAAAVLLPFILLTTLTRGQFAVHTVLYNMNTWHPEDLLRWARHAWFLYRWLLVALVATVVGFTRLRDPVWIYAALALLSSLTIAKAGSAENYLIEPLAALLLALGDGLGRVGQILRPGQIRQRLAWGAAVGCLVLHAGRLSSPGLLDAVFSKRPAAADLAAASEATSRLRRVEGLTWSELALYNIRAGKGLVFQPFIMSELVRQKRWDPEPFLEQIRRGRYALIVTNRDISRPADEVYAPRVLHALRSAYRETGRIDTAPLWKFYFYEPLP